MTYYPGVYDENSRVRSVFHLIARGPGIMYHRTVVPLLHLLALFFAVGGEDFSVMVNRIYKLSVFFIVGHSLFTDEEWSRKTFSAEQLYRF